MIKWKFIKPTEEVKLKILPERVVNLYNCPPKTLRDEKLLFPIKGYGVKYFRKQIFSSPLYSKVTNAAEFKAHWSKTHEEDIHYCKDNGIYIVGMMDEAFREIHHRQAFHNFTEMEECIAFICDRVRDVCPYLEVVDESKTAREYQPEKFVQWIRKYNGPLIAWPGQFPGSLQTPELCDYVSNYSSFWGGTELTLPYQLRMLDNCRRNGKNYTYNATLIWACGPLIKWGSKVNNGIRPRDILAQIWFALSFASILGVYGIDWKLWRDIRANYDGKGEYQTGMYPVDRTWYQFGRALSYMEMYKDYLKGTSFVPTKSGPWRFCRWDNLVCGINGSDKPQLNPRNHKGVVAPGDIRFWRV